MRSLVLLGAGASYGSEEDPVLKPPLGANLFDALDELGGVAAKLPDDLKALFRSDFESGMAEYFIRYNANTSHFQKELAEFLSKYSPSPKSLYFKLVEVFDKKKVSYVSLNYDLLLERAIIGSNKKVSHSLQTERNCFAVLKVHGSSNMWPKASNVFIGSISGFSTDIEAPVEFLNPDLVSDRLKSWNGVAPVISMYAKGKSVRNCPGAVLKQQDMWGRALIRSDVLYIIGVRVVEADDHIWKRIGEFEGLVVYFGGAADKSEFESWKSKHPANKSIFKEMYFKEAIDYIKGNAAI